MLNKSTVSHLSHIKYMYNCMVVSSGPHSICLDAVPFCLKYLNIN